MSANAHQRHLPFSIATAQDKVSHASLRFLYQFENSQGGPNIIVSRAAQAVSAWLTESDLNGLPPKDPHEDDDENEEDKEEDDDEDDEPAVIREPDE
jgi:hypothetical protein